MLTYDIRAVQIDSRQELFDVAGGMQITGPVMLGQRVLVELLTNKGSLGYLPTRGTRFLPALDIAHSTEADVFAAYGIGEVDLQTNLQREESTQDPPEERYLRSEIETAIVTDNAVDIEIRIFSRRNTSQLLKLPTIVIIF